MFIISLNNVSKYVILFFRLIIKINIKGNKNLINKVINIEIKVSVIVLLYVRKMQILIRKIRIFF